MGIEHLNVLHFQGDDTAAALVQGVERNPGLQSAFVKIADQRGSHHVRIPAIQLQPAVLDDRSALEFAMKRADLARRRPWRRLQRAMVAMAERFLVVGCSAVPVANSSIRCPPL